MRPLSPLPRLAAAAVTAALALSTTALAESTEVTRKQNADGSARVTIANRLPTEWEAKVGVDVGVAGEPATTFEPGKPLPWEPRAHAAGAAWAKVTVPDLPAGIGFDKATVDARIDPTKDQRQLGTTLSRSWSLGDALTATIKDSYAITQTTPAETAASESWETGKALSIGIGATGTSVSAGAKMSSTDEVWQRTLSAEQTLFGGVNVTTSVTDKGTGVVDRSLKAGFKRSW